MKQEDQLVANLALLYGESEVDKRIATRIASALGQFTEERNFGIAPDGYTPQMKLTPQEMITLVEGVLAWAKENSGEF